jgi:hypothetical protein
VGTEAIIDTSATSAAPSMSKEQVGNAQVIWLRWRYVSHPPTEVFVTHLKSKLPTRIDQEAWYSETPDLYKPHRTALCAATLDYPPHRRSRPYGSSLPTL